MTLDRTLRLLTIVIVFGLGALGLARGESVLSGGVAWLAFLFFVLSGFGWFVVRLVRVDDPDFGLRAAWGLGGYIAITGPLVMAGVCSRPVILVLIACGAAGFTWRELVTSRPLWKLVRGGAAALRRQPLLGYLAILLALAALVRMLGAVVALERNPWDDDVAYLPLLKRLLDIGEQIEPFSFRRLGAYGGQVVLQALGAARGTLGNPHLVDQGLCFGLTLLLLLGHARALGRVQTLWLALAVIAVLVMPDISINTASYWSGVVCFLALYRTLARDTSPTSFALAALLAAATCTLRQSYLPVVALFLIVALVSRRADRRTWLRTILVAGAVLLPWCVAAFLSNRTFLFPFMQGTWNHGLSLAPTGWSWVDKLSFLVTCLIDAQPLVVLPLLFPLFVVVRDRRPARPLTALFIASTAGFLLLVVSFMGSDAHSLSRYAFGYVLPLVLVFVLEASSEDDAAPLEVPAIARWVLLAALVIQVAYPRAGVAKRYRTVFVETAEAMTIERTGDPNAHVEAARYARMQAALPEGARVAVLLDDPMYLDFSRNEIFNLDTPGYASPGTQLPMFVGAEPVRSYFVAQGIRHLAFVRSDHSRYMFRRGFWLWRIFNDVELFQVMSAYMVDTFDTLTELARTSKVLYDEGGLVVVDLGSARVPLPQLDPAQESARRDAWMQQLATREGFEREWALTSRRNLIFADGISGVTFDDLDADPKWYDVYYRDPAPRRGVPVRWLHRRGHLRVTGTQDMRLVLRGRINLASIYTRPRLDVSLDGVLLASTEANDRGEFAIDIIVPGSQVRDWADLYLVFNTIGTPERDVRDLRIARLEHVTWEPR